MNDNALTFLSILSLFLHACGGSSSSSTDSPGPAVPEDFPQVQVLVSNNPAPGVLYLANIGRDALPGPSTYTPYIMTIDTTGLPTFFQKIDSPVGAFDFKIGLNGRISFCTEEVLNDGLSDGFLTAMDSNHTIKGTFRVPDGEGNTDLHDSMMLPDGHVIMLANETVSMDLSAFGGSPAADVLDCGIVEIDGTGSVVFSWWARDHVQVDEAASDIDLTTAPPGMVDYVHANSIDLDADNNLILSCRHLDQVMKIDHTTGAVVWRLGGKRSDFVFVNDPFNGTSHQHCARILPNGNVIMFDNGNLRNPQASRAVEYRLDVAPSPKTATLVWQFANTPPVYAFAMGSVQRLPNGNTLIGWGEVSNPAATEVTPAGDKAFELAFPDPDVSYRAFKF